MLMTRNLREETVLLITSDQLYFLYVNLETKIQNYVNYVSCFKRSSSTSY